MRRENKASKSIATRFKSPFSLCHSHMESILSVHKWKRLKTERALIQHTAIVLGSLEWPPHLGCRLLLLLVCMNTDKSMKAYSKSPLCTAHRQWLDYQLPKSTDASCLFSLLYCLHRLLGTLSQCCMDGWVEG